MIHPAWWRVLGVAAGAAGVAAPLLVAHRGIGAVERRVSEEIATAVAGYVGLVAPPVAAGQAAYDPRGLLVAARGLATIPGWGAPVEVYAARTPLIAAGAPGLPRDVWRTLARRETPLGYAGGALAPLKDRDQWDVVGAVWTADPRAPRSRRVIETGALVAVVALGAVWAVGQSRRRRMLSLVLFVAAVTLHAATAGTAVRQAARWGTDRALADVRLLVRELPVRLPGPASRVPLPTLQRAIQGTAVILVEADSADPGVARVERDGVPRAVARVRLSARRWGALEMLPLEVTAGRWTLIALGLGLFGPGLAAVAGWGAAAATRPRRLRETVTAWGFLAPAALHLAVFSFAPIGFALWLAFHQWSPLEPVRPFVGLANFAALAQDPLVGISLRNTVVYALYVPVTMVLALAVALSLNRPGRLVRWVRTAFFVPYVSSVVAVALVWQWMLSPDFGLLNWVLGAFGVAPVDWLGGPRTALLSVMLISVWVQLGYQMMVFLAGLQAIPQTYLDAARVDGANAWQRFRYVTWPLLRPVTLFVLVTGVIASFQVFTYIYVLTDGGPLHATDVIVYRIYQSAWEFLRFGYASALALGLLVLLLGVTWVQFRLLGRQVEYG